MVALRRFDPEDALERALHVFWAKGFDAASAQDLVDAMQINRGSLYATFGSKRELHRQALDRYLARDRARLATALDGTRPLRSALAHLLGDDADALAGDPQRRGCLLANTCAQLDPDDHELRDLLSDTLDNRRTLLSDALTAAQRRGEFPDHRDPEALAAYLVAVMQGMRLIGKTTADRDTLQHIIDTALSALDGTAGHSSHG